MLSQIKDAVRPADITAIERSSLGGMGWELYERSQKKKIIKQDTAGQKRPSEPTLLRIKACTGRRFMGMTPWSIFQHQLSNGMGMKS